MYVANAPDVSVNPIDHLKCFTDDPGSTYRLTMSVDQPTADSPEPLNLGATFTDKHKVGHAFLTLTQTQSDGTVIRRSIGFYPASAGDPISPSGPPAFGDDANYGNWDVQVTFNVNGSEMTQIVTYIQQYGNQNYHLFNRNCGNMCTGVLGMIGVGISGDWMNYPFGMASSGTGMLQGPNSFYTIYGPSIGLLGERLFQAQSARIINRTHAGGPAPSNAGSCN